MNTLLLWIARQCNLAALQLNKISVVCLNRVNRNLFGTITILLLAGCSAPVQARKCLPMIPPMAAAAATKEIKFQWSHPQPATVEYYKLHYGPKSGIYTNYVTSTTTNVLFQADLTSVHYFTVTAHAGGEDSYYSNEVPYPPELQPRTNVVVVSQWSSNTVDWVEVRRDTNAVNGTMGFWRLRIE